MVTILFIFLNFVFPFLMCIVLNEAKIWKSDVKRDTELSILCYTRLVPYYLVAGQKQNVMWKTAEVFFVHSDEACYENICKESYLNGVLLICTYSEIRNEIYALVTLEYIN